MPERRLLSIADIHVSRSKRRSLDRAKVRAMAEDIRAAGQQSPIIVREDGPRFVLVQGLHRLEACRSLGESTVPAYLVQAAPPGTP